MQTAEHGLHQPQAPRHNRFKENGASHLRGSVFLYNYLFVTGAALLLRNTLKSFIDVLSATGPCDLVALWA
jgi:hypothetical protein